MQMEVDSSTPRLYSSRIESLPTSIPNKFGTMPHTPAQSKLGNIPNTPLAFKYGTMPHTPGAQSANLPHTNSVPTSLSSIPHTPFLATMNKLAPNSPSFLKSDPMARNSMQPRPISFTPSEKNTPVLEKEDSLTASTTETMERRYTSSNKEIPFRTISRHSNVVVAVSDTLQRPSITSESLNRPIEKIPEEPEPGKEIPILHINIEPEEPLFIAIEEYVPSLPDEIPIKIGDKIQILIQYPDDWALGINKTIDMQGVFPCVCIKPIFTKRKVVTPTSIFKTPTGMINLKQGFVSPSITEHPKFKIAVSLICLVLMVLICFLGLYFGSIYYALSDL
ncbi:hypothetical protein HDV06_002785 [Boothiomyces sp. JEL0866]|nr:hypothetical protein HDV06_002785 [Boothiomyces sp. JEL0866]